MGTFFAARENQYPGAQLQYIFFHCAKFHSISPSSIGDLARNRKCTKMLTDRQTDGQTDPDPIVPRARATRRAGD